MLQNQKRVVQNKVRVSIVSRMHLKSKLRTDLSCASYNLQAELHVPCGCGIVGSMGILTRGPEAFCDTLRGPESVQ